MQIVYYQANIRESYKSIKTKLLNGVGKSKKSIEIKIKIIKKQNKSFKVLENKMIEFIILIKKNWKVYPIYLNLPLNILDLAPSAWFDSIFAVIFFKTSIYIAKYPISQIIFIDYLFGS